MEHSNKTLRLLEIIYANAVAREIQNIRREICCGCKVCEQDCLMMTEQEAWETHGLTAITQVNSHQLVWHEFTNIIEILNTEVQRDFAEHLMCLQKDPDQNFVEELLYKYTKTTVSNCASYANYLTFRPTLWNLMLNAISVILAVTCTLSREQMKNSDLTKQTVKKHIKSIRKTNSVNILVN